MRKLLYTLLLLTLLAIWTLPLLASDIVTTMLPNGMRVAVKKTTDPNVALYIFVNTGSIHEGEYLGHGISHFVEHIIAGGSTTLRSEAEYQAIASEIGANINAGTDYESTEYHIIVDAQYLDTALQILSEQIMYCSFDEAEVEREKGVITQEIVMRSTPPQAQRYQRMMQVFHYETHYRYPVIGYVENLLKLTRDDLISYYQKRYTPHNMVFVVVGGFPDTDEMIAKVTETFADFRRPPAQEIYQPSQSLPISTYTVIEEFDLEQTLVSTDRPILDIKQDDMFALDMASAILFDKRSSPIRYYLVEEAQLVDNVYADTGINFVPKNIADIPKILSIIDEKLLEYTKPKKITQKMLDDVIRAEEADAYLHYSSVDHDAEKIGYHMLEYNLPDFDDKYLTELKKVTIADVQRVIAEHYLGNKVIFVALPRGTRDELPARGWGGFSGSTAEVVKSDIQKHIINDRITLIYKQSTEKPIVRATVFIPSSIAYEDETNAGTIEFMASLLFKGSRRYPSLALSNWLDDRAIRLKAYPTTGGINISFSCLVADLDDLVDRISDALTNPSFSEDEIQMYKDRYAARIRRYSTDPSNIHHEYVDKIIYENPRDKLSDADKLPIINAITRADLVNAHRRFITADKVTVSVLGDIDENRARRFASNISSKIPNRAVAGNFVPIAITISDSVFVNIYEHEQVNLHIEMLAPTVPIFPSMEGAGGGNKDFFTMLTIEKILTGGSLRGRLHNATRRDNDLAYIAYASYSYTKDYGRLHICSQTSLEQKEELLDVLIGEINKLKTEPVPIEEIISAVTDFAKTEKTSMDDEVLVNAARIYEVRGLGYDFIDTCIPEMLAVTPEDILRVANKYFERYDVIVSQPEDSE